MTRPALSTLTIQEAMDALKVSRSTIERRIADGTLKATRKFGHPRILESSVMSLFDADEAGSPEPTTRRPQTPPTPP